jgi:hypothetical protein
VTHAEIARRRLAGQRIAGGPPAAPHEVVSHLVAMQAQDYPGAVWSVALRVPGATQADIERAIAERKIVRTWPMRGTLHFVAAPDVRWLLALLAPRVVASAAPRHRALGLDDGVFARSRKLLIGALRGGNRLTRNEAYEVLERGRIRTSDMHGYVIVWRLAHDGVICFGPHEGKEPTLVLLEEWVPASSAKDRGDALGELARRYFTGHGPATLRDFAWWSALKMGDARAGLEAAAPHLAREDAGGAEYWGPREKTRPPAAGSTAQLLPGFDQFLLGYQDRDASLDPRHAKRVIPGGNAVFMPTMLLDGRVVGTWKRKNLKKSVAIATSPFSPLKEPAARAFARAAERFGQFLGVPVDLPS